MQLTRGAEYAIRAVLDLTANHTGQKSGKVQLKDIASRMDIPDDFLAKIFQMLNRSGIIKSYRGTKGGYALAREPKDINVKDVIYAVDGPIRLNKCLAAEGPKTTVPVAAAAAVAAAAVQDIMNGLTPMIDKVLATNTPVILMPPFAAPGFVQE